VSAGEGVRRIGVIGGMGPEATVLLMSRVIALTPAADDADHVPLVVDNNTQVPSRIKALIERSGEDPAPVLAAMARRLEAYGVDALAMPCNTAHHYAPAIVEAVRVPFLDMVALSTAAAAQRAPAGGSIGVLGSPAVRITGLFDAPLRRHGLTASYPADDAKVLAAIRRIKANSRDEEARRIAREAARELGAGGAQAVLVACTEFSLIAGSLCGTVPLVDSIDVLAGAIIAFARDGEPAVPARTPRDA